MGKRLREGKEYSFFNELQIIQKSNFQTFSFICDFRTQENYEILEKDCLSNEIANWTTDVEILCKACSEGKPHEIHKHEPNFKDKLMTIAFASESEDILSETLIKWKDTNNIEYDEFYKY